MDNSIAVEDALKTVINCESTVDISNAASLYGHLKNAIENQHEVEIHTEHVERVDTAILQLFTAFVMEAKTSNMEVRWKSVSKAFYKSAQLTGLTNELGLPEPV